MQDITIGRYVQDPQAQGVIRPKDGRWQLVLDSEGYPHLYLQVSVVNDEGVPAKAMLALDDLLPENTNIKGLMTELIDGRLSPEDEAQAYADFQATERKVPCPR